MTQSIMKAIGNCLADIRHYRPQYPAQNDLSKHDRWIQFKFWLKNYARMGSLLIKVGPTRLIASLRAYPWLYDLLKANAMYQRAVFGRSGNYREAVAVAFDVIVAGTVEVCRMPLRCTFSAGSKQAMAPSSPRAAMIETSRTKGTKLSRIIGTPPSASKAPAGLSSLKTRWPLPS